MKDSETLRERFNRVADALTVGLGSLPALVGSVLVVVVWAMTGPIFGFSDTWQLFINTFTTVVTFWMVFVIQNSANRSSKATQLKLDELIRAVDKARNEFIALDQAPERVLVQHEQELVDLANGGAKKRVVKRTTRQIDRVPKRRARVAADGGAVTGEAASSSAGRSAARTRKSEAAGTRAGH